MIILVETPAYKAWEAYHKATQERVIQYGGIVLMLSVYALLMTFARTPTVMAYNGVDMWYWLVEQVPFGGTLLMSFFLIAWLGNPVVCDIRGVKTIAERRADIESKKKDKNFAAKDKKPYKLNPYYLGIALTEGFLYGSLMFAVLPEFLTMLFNGLGENGSLPKPFDSLSSVWVYHSNVVQDIALAFGAGVYEELIFRGLFFMLIFRLAKAYGKKSPFLKQFDLPQDQLKPFPIKIPKYNKKSNSYLLLIFLSTVIYASSHVIMPFGDHLSLFSFLYRMFFGGLMYAIFVWRGPVMAAWTHVVYDLLYFGLRWWL